MPRASGGSAPPPRRPTRVYVAPSARGTGVRGAVNYINSSTKQQTVRVTQNRKRANVVVSAGSQRKVNQDYRALGGTGQVGGFQAGGARRQKVEIVKSQGPIAIGRGGVYNTHKYGVPQFTGPSYIPSTTRVATHELGHALGLGHKARTVMGAKKVSEGFDKRQTARLRASASKRRKRK